MATPPQPNHTPCVSPPNEVAAAMTGLPAHTLNVPAVLRAAELYARMVEAGLIDKASEFIGR